MNRISLGVLAMTFGVLLLLQNMHLFPTSFCETIVRTGWRFWPFLLIIFGIHLLVKDKTRIVGKIMQWLLIFFLGLWVICRMFG